MDKTQNSTLQQFDADPCAGAGKDIPKEAIYTEGKSEQKEEKAHE